MRGRGGAGTRIGEGWKKKEKKRKRGTSHQGSLTLCVTDAVLDRGVVVHVHEDLAPVDLISTYGINV